MLVVVVVFAAAAAAPGDDGITGFLNAAIAVGMDLPVSGWIDIS